MVTVWFHWLGLVTRDVEGQRWRERRKADEIGRNTLDHIYVLLGKQHPKTFNCIPHSAMPDQRWSVEKPTVLLVTKLRYFPGQACYHVTVIPVPGWWRQEDCEVESSLSYRVRLCLEAKTETKSKRCFSPAPVFPTQHLLSDFLLFCWRAFLLYHFPNPHPKVTPVKRGEAFLAHYKNYASTASTNSSC